MKSIIFLGPSLPLQEAQKILDAIYLPPAKQSDFLSVATHDQPDVIGLIDGEFMQSLSVWHKEILYALDQGILVYGASSMGALRAAELKDFGMQGVGTIFRMYAEGELADDDEVALSHGPAESGYRKVSEPMVNIRATIQLAQRRGVVTEELGSQVIKIAKSLYFPDRTFKEIFKKAGETGISTSTLKSLEHFVTENYVDLKAQDAVELLTQIKNLSDLQPGPEKKFKFVRTPQFDTLYNRGRSATHRNTDLKLEDIANHVALHYPDFHDFNFNTLNRLLVVFLGRLLELKIDEQSIDSEAKRFRTRHNLGQDAEFKEWLKRNDLSLEEFQGLMEEIAICRRLQHWHLITRWMERSTKPILDQLRLQNQYEYWADHAADNERLRILAPDSDDFESLKHTSLDQLLKDQQEWSDFRADTESSTWIEEAGFHTLGNFKAELLRARKARFSLLSMLANSMTTSEMIDEKEASTGRES